MNMKNLIVIIIVFLAVVSCKEKAKEPSEESVEEIEKTPEEDQNWTTLFNGNSFEGWHFYRASEVTTPWKIENGAMVFYPPKKRAEGVTYNIVTDKSYTNFVLSLEWKISEGGNSGVFWGIYEDEKYKHPYETGPEIQVLDNEKHPDAKNGPIRQAGALYDMFSPTTEAVKAAGEWNQYVITVNHKVNEASVVLNHKEIAKFPLSGPIWEKMIANSKFASWEGFAKYKTGKIGLQDHNDVVSYRNIKIKEL